MMISIIVPVYNTEQYLPDCLDNILSQSFTDFELLLIDDGSTDGSGAICDAYAKKDSRIRVFHKENGGVSSARNFGIKKASGEFLTFVDSDDILGEKYLEHLMGSDSDLVITGLQMFGAWNETTIFSEERRVYRFGFSQALNMPKVNLIYLYIGAKRFRKSIIQEHGILFDVTLFNLEDMHFVFSYMLHIDVFVELPFADYQYRINDIDFHKRYKMNASQLIQHYNSCDHLFELMETGFMGSFQYVRNYVNLNFLRFFYTFLQDCSSYTIYKKNTQLFHQQEWPRRILRLLEGKREKRVLYGAYYMPSLSYLVENKVHGIYDRIMKH